MEVISFNRKEWEAWRDNKVVSYSFLPNGKHTCQWCKKVHKDVLPTFDAQLWHTCYSCHFKIFPAQDSRTYEDIIDQRERHNKYWDRITGGKVPPIKVTEVHDEHEDIR